MKLILKVILVSMISASALANQCYQIFEPTWPRIRSIRLIVENRDHGFLVRLRDYILQTERFPESVGSSYLDWLNKKVISLNLEKKVPTLFRAWKKTEKYVRENSYRYLDVMGLFHEYLFMTEALFPGHQPYGLRLTVQEMKLEGIELKRRYEVQLLKGFIGLPVEGRRGYTRSKTDMVVVTVLRMAIIEMMDSVKKADNQRMTPRYFANHDYTHLYLVRQLFDFPEMARFRKAMEDSKLRYQFFDEFEIFLSSALGESLVHVLFRGVRERRRFIDVLNERFSTESLKNNFFNISEAPRVSDRDLEAIHQWLQKWFL